MPKSLAQELFATGRSHALASDLLYRSALAEGSQQNLPDQEHFAFNGTYSLSTHYLLGLGLELMLKAAIVSFDETYDEKALRNIIGHDLIKALDTAESVGFRSNAPRLREILSIMQTPFKQHWLRYSRPETFPLPGKFDEVVLALDVLDQELRMLIWAE